MINKKVAVVNLVGGLGIQLYQIVLSKYLQQHGHSVIIDLSWFKSIKHKPYTEKNWIQIEY